MKTREAVAQVMRVTRTGQIVVRRKIGMGFGEERRFSRSGKEVGGDKLGYDWPYLVPVEQLEEKK